MTSPRTAYLASVEAAWKGHHERMVEPRKIMQSVLKEAEKMKEAARSKFKLTERQSKALERADLKSAADVRRAAETARRRAESHQLPGDLNRCVLERRRAQMRAQAAD